jgi:hypothetical protein
MLMWCRYVLWMFLSSETFVTGQTTDAERTIIGLLRIRALMQTFMGNWRRDQPEHRLTGTQEVTPKMVGAAGDPKLKLKASETYTFL